MTFDLTDDQDTLRRTARELCGRLYPMSAVRTFEDRGTVDRSGWTEFASAGMFVLHRDEDQGGLGLGRVELALVFEELGRALVPGPLASTAAAAGVIEQAKPDAVIGIADNRGAAPFTVEHLSSLDWIVAVGRDVVVVDAAAIDRSAVRAGGAPLDPLTPIALVDRLPAGERIGGSELAAQLLRDGALLVAAQAAGAAAAATDLSAAYALQREQFGVRIGTFQAVKHLLADMRVHAELAQVAVEAAAVLIDEGSAEADAAVSTAKVVAGEAATANGRSCVQIHGGMGFAWEVDAHLFQKRAWVLEHLFGTTTDHSRALADGWRVNLEEQGAEHGHS
jgi:alkylation response protein AidB-like acyl-CoA dehydrogenase